MTLSFRRNVGSSCLPETRMNFLVLAFNQEFSWFLSESLTWSPFGEDTKMLQAQCCKHNFNLTLYLIMRAERKKGKENLREIHSHLFLQRTKLHTRDAGRYTGSQIGGDTPAAWPRAGAPIQPQAPWQRSSRSENVILTLVLLWLWRAL